MVHQSLVQVADVRCMPAYGGAKRLLARLMTARVRKAFVGGDGVGALSRRANLLRALPMSRVVRAAQKKSFFFF